MILTEEEKRERKELIDTLKYKRRFLDLHQLNNIKVRIGELSKTEYDKE